MTLREFLENGKIPFAEEEDLSRHTSIRCGGRCSFFVSPQTKEALVACVDFLWRGGYPWQLVGHMTNTLPPDGETETVFLSTRSVQGISLCGDVAEAASGVGATALFRFLLKEGRLAFPPLLGIPGTVGGAVRGNAGAFGYETADALLSAEVYFYKSGKTEHIPWEEMKFSYRYSRLKEEEDAVLLSARYRALRYDRESAKAEILRCAALRRASQPVGEPSLGSVFLRVGETSAAWYIDRLGMKGARVGGAKVSEKHAGFIVNAGGATSHDVSMLIRKITEEVRAGYGISLIPEIQIL